MPLVSSNVFFTLAFWRGGERGLPLLFDREMGDVVLDHLELVESCRRLLHKAGIAGGIEDDISEPEKGKARCSCEQQSRTTDDPLTTIFDVNLHRTSYADGTVQEQRGKVGLSRSNR